VGPGLLKKMCPFVSVEGDFLPILDPLIFSYLDQRNFGLPTLLVPSGLVKTEVLGDKPVPVPFCSPHVTRGLTRDLTWASAVRKRRLTA
jgi:hypothetical protein